MTSCLGCVIKITKNRGDKIMRINLVTAVVLGGGLLISSCGDQVWCGENGCGSDSNANRDRSTRAAPMNIQNGSILKNML